jgi:hypothetical protein
MLSCGANIMPENKTQKNDGDVTAFLMTVENETKRNDCFKLVDIMGDITGDTPSMWGDSIVWLRQIQILTCKRQVA